MERLSSKRALIKRGSLDQTSELTILDGKKIIAKATTTLKALHGSINLEAMYPTDKDQEGNVWLTGVNVGGKFATINVDKSGASASSAMQE